MGYNFVADIAGLSSFV